jgi:glycerol-3-phosphate acyltransferase PlsY
MLELGIKILLSYLIGSVLGSMVMGKLRGVDIRSMGSGNAGGTNALRTQGLLFALGVVVIDIGKGALATAYIPGLALPMIPIDPTLSPSLLLYCCAGASVVGHVWPVWHHFKGGKGAATLMGTLLVAAPAIVFPLLLIWAWVLVVTGYVGLATILAGLAAPAWVAMMMLPHDQPLFYYCVVMSLLLIYTHRSNIRRMRNRSEPQNTRLMLFRRKQQQAGDGEE